MSTNQQIILATLLEQQKASLADTFSDDDYFHLFVTDQVLKTMSFLMTKLKKESWMVAVMGVLMRFTHL